MHRRAAWVPILLFALAVPGHAEEAEAPADDVRVWSGYVRREGGRLEMGYPVVAKGVAGGPVHVVETSKDVRLAQLAQPVDDVYVFWNYTLERPHDEVADKLPHVLVRVRGPVRPLETGEGIVFDAPLVMKPATVLSVEFVDPAWLEHWAVVFREKDSPWRIRDEPKAKDPAARLRVLAPTILAALRKMRAVPGPTKAQHEHAAAVAPGAKVVSHFRRHTELEIARWLAHVDEEHDLGLEGLDEVPLPPDDMTLRRWLVEAETRSAFLERVRKAWKGDLGVLLLPNYVESGNRISWVRTPVDDVATWDDEKYAVRRERTKRMMVGERAR